MNTIPLLLGPTATGKSGIALALAQRCDGEIINADARAVYRGMDIGTAKPSVAERQQAPHHLIDICDPTEIYNPQRFRENISRLIPELQARNKLPIIVGGSTLYVEAITVGLFEGVGADPVLRRQMDETPLETLYQRLREVDPPSAARLKPNDRVRITRALEVFALSGQPISRLQPTAAPLPYPFQKFGLYLERSKLYARINQRVDLMVERGLIEEAEQFYGQLKPGFPAYKTIGYQELFEHFAGRCALGHAIEKIKQHTRNYAKRQMTWFRRYSDIVWLDTENQSAETLAQRIIRHIRPT